jgi:uncharacterized protein
VSSPAAVHWINQGIGDDVSVASQHGSAHRTVVHPMFNWIAVVLIVAAALALTVRVFESRFAFFPSIGEDATPADYGVAFEATTIATRDGERLRVWTLRHSSPHAEVVYFHGNGGNLSVWTPIVVGIQQHGYSVHAIDYRGYGASTGSPGERGLYRDVDAFTAWVAQQPQRQRVPLIYWGRSLGTTMAAYAATVVRPDGLVAESGFVDARSLLRGSPPLSFLALFSSFRFPTSSFIGRARVPLLVLHGDRDRVVPFASGRAMFEAAPEPKTFVVVRGGDHNDAVPADPERYWAAVEKFVGRLK